MSPLGRVFHRHPPQVLLPGGVTVDDMVSALEKLAASKAAPIPFKDVTVALRADVAEQRAELETRLADAQERMAAARDSHDTDKRLSSPEFDASEFQAELDAIRADAEALAVKESESLMTLRLWMLRPDEWANVTAHNTPRPDVQIDMTYGYNVHGIAREASEINGRVVEDDGSLFEFDAENWAEFWEQLSGHDYVEIAAAVFELNDYGPAARLERLGNVSRPLPVTSQDSQE